jgi:hypothetical protein
MATGTTTRRQLIAANDLINCLPQSTLRVTMELAAQLGIPEIRRPQCSLPALGRLFAAARELDMIRVRHDAR